MHRFKNILVVCDESDPSEALIERVRWLAGVNAARVTLATVVSTQPRELSRLLAALSGSEDEIAEAGVLDSHRARLEALAEPLRTAKIEVRTVVDHSPASLELVRRVLRDGHDLLIKDAQREEDWPFLHGLDMQLLRKCPCPVWILNRPGEARSRRILAAVDTSSSEAAHEGLNRTILELATSLARQDGARLDVVSVWDVPEEQALRHGRLHMPEETIAEILARERDRSARRLEALARGFPQEADWMRVLHLRGQPARTIVQHAQDEAVDTIVMGTVARTGIAGFLIGNTAETILGRVTCSVLAIKPIGFVSSVEADTASREPVLV